MAMRNMIVITVTTTMVMVMISIVGGSASWCVAKIGASEEALQTALDSACEAGGGADCAPIQPDGLCYVPNTLQAHASYAFNSFYQRNTRAPHACLFHGASTIAQTDPSKNYFHSCNHYFNLDLIGSFIYLFIYFCTYRLWILRVPILRNPKVCRPLLSP